MSIHEYSDIFMNTNNHECLGSDLRGKVRELERPTRQRKLDDSAAGRCEMRRVKE
jgi:hypothetical protein